MVTNWHHQASQSNLGSAYGIESTQVFEKKDAPPDAGTKKRTGYCGSVRSLKGFSEGRACQAGGLTPAPTTEPADPGRHTDLSLPNEELSCVAVLELRP